MTYTIYTEQQLLSYVNKTHDELKTLMKNGDELARIQMGKNKFGLSGDVYVVDGYIMDRDRHYAKYGQPMMIALEENSGPTMEQLAQTEIAYRQMLNEGE